MKTVKNCEKQKFTNNNRYRKSSRTSRNFEKMRKCKKKKLKGKFCKMRVAKNEVERFEVKQTR